MSLSPGQMLAHYRLVKKLGEGGMGVVWSALDTRLNREVAVKLLQEEIQQDRVRLERLEREAISVAGLNHPNIVTIHAIEEFDGLTFFTMELVPGQTLDKEIPPGGLPLGRFLKYSIPIADALATAHDQGIIHRDIKPGNIMVTNEGRIKVLDFGLAESVGSSVLADLDNQSTWTYDDGGGLLGTISFMSPEQLRGGSGDHRSDIFSLGIILYLMATGRHPFSADSAADAIASTLRDTPLPIPDLKPGFPDRLWLVVEQCLQKDPERRLLSANGIRGIFEQFAASAGHSNLGLRTSIAVLPFSDLSPERDQDYFCEGVAEEIINALTKVRNLHVIPRTSSFPLKAAGLSSQQIGARLAVRNVLEGSVRKADDDLRITVELADVVEEGLLWSERYDRKLQDVFAIQDEIARNVVQALEVRLGPEGSASIQRVHTHRVEAYEFYLRGRQFYYQYRAKGIEFAVEMFKRAIEIDPEYALAYAGIADCCSYLYLYVERNEDTRNEADRASGRALQLGPELAGAHASRGVVLSLSNRNDEAVEAFERAISLDSRLFEAYYFYARHCFVRGELEKAIWLFEQSNAVRPEDYQAPLLVAQVYESMGLASEAEESRLRGLRIVERQLRVHPDDSRAWYMGANALVSLGQLEEGLHWAGRALEIDPEDSMVLYNLGCVKALAGKVDEAIGHLEKSVEHGLRQKGWFEMDSNLDELRSSPRFQALMDLLG